MSEPSPEILPLELFRRELEEQSVVLNQALLALEATETDPDPQAPAAAGTPPIDRLMRALHSIKGSAAMVALQDLVALTHSLEDRFAAVRAGSSALGEVLIALGFQCIDLFQEISQQPSESIEANLADRQASLLALIEALRSLPTTLAPAMTTTSAAMATATPAQPVSATSPEAGDSERVVRVEADNLNRIMSLSGELLVEARWLQPFADSLQRLRQQHRDLQSTLEALRLELNATGHSAGLELVEQARQREREVRDLLSERLAELELYALRTTNLSDRLYREVIGSNMRPFADALVNLPRLVRDLATALGKQVQLEMVGRSTLVDRDILRRLEAPLIHLLRNAVDHGIESPAERQACGKSARGLLRIEALHRGGMLSITVSDDGGGIDVAAVQARLVESGQWSADQADNLTPAELQSALEQPGFSTAPTVTEVSGRGVGLDVVKAMVNAVGGMVRLTSKAGAGTTIHFQLPLTLSVVRTLLVEIGAEPYAFPLARLDQIVAVEAGDVQLIEARECVQLDGQAIGLVSARQVFGCTATVQGGESLPVVVISDHEKVIGVVVDRLLGEQDLVVRPLDPRLGKVANISAAALMGDGQPILVVDTADLLRSIDALLKAEAPASVRQPNASGAVKRVLIADDSHLAVNLQAQLLRSRGYRVDTAGDGMEALKFIGTNAYDLLITDVDMPGLDGIELIRNLRREPQYAQLPIMISSSQEREQDRLLGLDAGADYYLVKSDFQSETLLDAVHNLIGPATAAAASTPGR